MKLCIVPLVAMAAIGFSTPSLAQYNAAVDVSRCFSPILQKTNLWKDNEDTHYRLLTTFTKEDYESLKLSGNLLAFIPGLAVDGSFDAAKAQATRLIQTHDETLWKSRQTFSSVVSLDGQATDLFRECIKGMVDRNPYGLFYYYTYSDHSTAQLQLIWRWIEGMPVKILSSTIDGGYIAGTNPKRRSLFEPSVLDRVRPPRFSQGQNFILKFDDPNKDINVALDLDPQVQYWPIVIPHLPLRKRCETKWETSTNEIPNQRVVEVVPENHFTGKKKGGGDEFSVSYTVDGVVTQVTCDKRGFGWMELDLANGANTAPGYGAGTNTATCTGWLNATPRSLLMTYSWKKDKTTCEIEEPWPVPK